MGLLCALGVLGLEMYSLWTKVWGRAVHTRLAQNSRQFLHINNKRTATQNKLFPIEDLIY